MTRVPSRELRNETAKILRRAVAGEQIEITVNGEAVAMISPLITGRSHWTARADFVSKLVSIQADSRLRDDLAELEAEAEELGPIR